MFIKWNGCDTDFFRDFDSLQDEVNRALQTVGLTRPSGVLLRPGTESRAYPLINLREDEDSFYAEVMAPGFDPESLNVSVLGTELTISGETEPTEEEPEREGHVEWSLGKFTRTITLSAEVDAEKVTADYTNGILKIALPKIAMAKPKQIEVSVN